MSAQQGETSRGAGRRAVDLRGKVVLVTGGNTGIGREAAVELASLGATVAVTSRDPNKGVAARDEIRRRSRNERVELVPLDLASFTSIRACAADVLDRFDRLDVLLNNAGGILSQRRETAEGFEMTFGVNHLGHFLLTQLLLDRLRSSAPSRIVNVASVAHRLARGGLTWTDLQREQHYAGTPVYNESKLANVLFTMELARRLAGSGVTANACHPGPVRTGFGSREDTTGIERFLMVLGRPFLISPRRGARVLVHLASSPLVEGSTGGYYVGSYLGRCHQSRPSRQGRDPAAARRLWELSEQLVAAAGAG